MSAPGRSGARECTNRPFPANERDAVLEYREYLVGEFVASRLRPDGAVVPTPVPNPMELWQALFLLQLDPYIVRTVSRMLRRWEMRQQQPGDGTGYLYVFRDSRDDANVYKIGSTTRDPRRRIAEWRRQLSADNGDDDNNGGGGGDAQPVRMLFAQATPAVRTAESIVHTMFFCDWLPRRIDVRSGRRLLEYFRIFDVAALRLLLRGVATFLRARSIQ